MVRKRLLSIPFAVLVCVGLPAEAEASGGEHAERPDDPPASQLTIQQRMRSPARSWSRGPFLSVQVNVDGSGNNIVGDAANEPSLAISSVDPNQIVIGWRQFDSVTSNFREAGFAYSSNRGQSWTFPGVLDEGVFRSDPVLGADADGNFYYSSLTVVDDVYYRAALFKSSDGGASWSAPVDAYGGDKQWITIDRTTGPGRGNLYEIWTSSYSCCGVTDFSRSIDGGLSFESPLPLASPAVRSGTIDIGPDGNVYIAGMGAGTGNLKTIYVKRSTDAQDALVTVPTFAVSSLNLDGIVPFGIPLNPAGSPGQIWLSTDHSGGATSGNVYVLATSAPSSGDPTDVVFSRSVDDAATWSNVVRVNDDDPDAAAWQWFGTMSVAPNGRIDAVWNDTREDPTHVRSTLFYSFSYDAGHNWWPNRPVSPDFDSTVGFPNQNKIGDYYHMLSDDGGANVAYAATFNGEQDVYFLRVPADCNGNGVEDDCDLSCGEPAGRCDVPGCGAEPDDDANGIPDACQRAFVCYKTKRTSGTPAPPKGLQIALDDDFNPVTTYDVKKPRGLCAPSSINGTSVPDTGTHLQGYLIKEAAGQPAHSPQLALEWEDVLLGSAVDTKKVDRVLVAANVDASTQPSSPTTHGLDRYECYKAKTTKGRRDRPLRRYSSFSDGFEDRQYEIKKLALVCSPAEKDGGGLYNPRGYLACYKIKAVKGQPTHTRREGLYTADELASLRQDTIKEELFCTAALTGSTP